jgi:hypothetical protein
MTRHQQTALNKITAIVGSIGHHPIAEPQPLDTGAVWAWYDHARFTIWPDGTYGSRRYDRELKRPA